jgi:hypothetical protein
MTTTSYSRFNRWAAAFCTGLTFSFAVGLAGSAHADEKKGRSLAEQLIQDVKDGKVRANSEDAGAVQELIVKRNIPISYNTINTLMHTPNAFGPGAACATCHSSQDAAKSYRGLDLTTCKGMIDGSTEEPKRALFVPGKDPKRDVLIRRLRNNRMPLGAGFHLPSDTPAFTAVKSWIVDGAKDDDHYKKNVAPLFRKANAFGPNTPACVACHMSNQEPPSFHELNLRTYAGVMLGADSVAKGVDKATKVVIPGNLDLSFLWQHLVEDRMPPGISPGENRDHPSTSILSLWIKQGAKCE